MTRLPWKPLEEALTAHFNGLPIHQSCCVCISGGPKGTNLRGGCWNFSQAGELLGVAKETISQWRRVGSVPTRNADRLAVRLDKMAWEIWPEWSDWANKKAFGTREIKVPQFV